MKVVGYLEGTDSVFLTRLMLRGVDTLPLGNGADNHGKYVGFVNKSDQVSLIIGYFHKVIPLAEQGSSPQELLHNCQLHNIPVLLIVPSEFMEEAKQRLQNVKAAVKLVDPAEVMTEARKILGV